MKGYEPSNWRALSRVDQIVSFSEDDIFIDFGSGKGRIVYLAARYPFKKIIGVEISEHFHEIAKANIANSRSRLKCRDIELINQNAADYMPEEPFSIAYFFNPFVNTIFEKVIENIKLSFLSNPRKLWIVYKKPIMADYLDTCEWLTHVHTNRNTAFYRSVHPDGSLIT